MAISLQKGGNVNLSKEAPGLSKLVVGLGWDVRNTDGAAFDIDSSAFLLKVDGKVRNDLDFVFYNNLKSQDQSVAHSGDNRTGAGDGDDETVSIDLGKVPADVERIAVCVTIHEADARRQNFGQVQKAFVRCVNAATNGEIARYDLSEDGSTETALVFGEVYRNNGDWKFKAVGQGYKGGLGALASNFGVGV
ncbi:MULTISPECIES: TerD family protein [Telluria group]|uniref:Tellurium resistance protein TerD n=1 Tax=Pseudoduganella violacea TaxID=1715466 RepID=A0A7W5B9Y5_9BURK|nr:MULTISPECIES: TerD family protein [Telluria group]AKU22452.1 chemical-damaging agent resistance protein C [Massilia sp. NR 4-1]MBB3119218.1 tellurium resistance protein TerD [Pseudoduganella violacea]NVE01076.1 TerD family protein [Massilia sp. BJB1822]UMR32763.1 TerD family protein [Massilia sp. MB5]UTY56312.1 TerD family protein [Massilia sp. erpn]